MADEQHDGTAREGDAKRTKAEEESGAFIAIGLVFFVLGIGGAARGESPLTAFLAVGIVFFVLGVNGAKKGRRDDKAGSDRGTAVVDGESESGPSGGGATGSDAGGSDGGGGGGGD